MDMAKTATEIATALGIPTHRVTYIVRTRQIKPVRWAGHARLFNAAEVIRAMQEATHESVVRHQGNS